MFTFGVQKKEDEAIETIDANSCSLMAERVHTVQRNVYRVVEMGGNQAEGRKGAAFSANLLIIKESEG